MRNPKSKRNSPNKKSTSSDKQFIIDLLPVKSMEEIDAIYNSVVDIAKYVAKQFVDSHSSLMRCSDNQKVSIYENYKMKFITTSTTNILNRLEKISDEKMRKKAMKTIVAISKNVEKRLK
jgi:uncharacterized protein YifN (PemK superfamily)